MFELVGAVRNLCTTMQEIANVLKEIRELMKRDIPGEKTNGGTKK